MKNAWTLEQLLRSYRNLKTDLAKRIFSSLSLNGDWKPLVVEGSLQAHLAKLQHDKEILILMSDEIEARMQNNTAEISIISSKILRQEIESQNFLNTLDKPEN